MERRGSRRVNVDSDVKGRVVLVSDCDISDISITGMRFLARRRILPNSRVNLDITKGGVRLLLAAVVVRAIIVSTGTPTDDEGPLYEVAVAFDADSKDGNQATLKSLIGQND